MYENIRVDQEGKLFLLILRPAGLREDVFFNALATELEIRRSTVGDIPFRFRFEDLLRCLEHPPCDGVAGHIFRRFLPEST